MEVNPTADGTHTQCMLEHMCIVPFRHNLLFVVVVVVVVAVGGGGGGDLTASVAVGWSCVHDHFCVV